MTKFKLETVMTYTDQSAAGMKKTASNLDGLESAVKGAQVAIQALAVVEVVKAVAELTQLGAQASAVEQRFTALAGGAGQAEQYLRAIRMETGNTVDKMTAMGAASKMLSMGLADDADSAAKLIAMAIQLGDQTQSTGDRVADFSALLANQSIPRLDNFGISSAKVRDRIRELQSEFPGLSREAAFNQAVLEQGAAALDRLGSSASNQAATLARAEVIWKDFKTSVAQTVADAIVPAVEGFNSLVNFSQNVSDALVSNTDAAVAAGKSWEEYAEAQLTAQLAAGRFADIGYEVQRALREQGASEEEFRAAMADTNSVIQAAIDLGVGYGDTLNRIDYEALLAGNAEAIDSYYGVGTAEARAAAEAAAFEESQRKSAEAAAAASIAFYDAASGLQEMSQATFVKTQLDNLKASLDAGIISSQEYANAQHALLTTFGILTPAEEAAQRTLENLNSKYASGQLSADAYAAAVARVKAGVDALKDKTITVTYNLKTTGTGPEGKGPGGQIPQAFQSGGVMPFTGMALVGEGGPELVRLPGGSQVYNNQQTRQFFSQDVINVDSGVAGLVLAERRARMLNRLAAGW